MLWHTFCCTHILYYVLGIAIDIVLFIMPAHISLGTSVQQYMKAFKPSCMVYILILHSFIVYMYCAVYIYTLIWKYVLLIYLSYLTILQDSSTVNVLIKLTPQKTGFLIKPTTKSRQNYSTV